MRAHSTKGPASRSRAVREAARQVLRARGLSFYADTPEGLRQLAAIAREAGMVIAADVLEDAADGVRI